MCISWYSDIISLSVVCTIRILLRIGNDIFNEWNSLTGRISSRVTYSFLLKPTACRWVPRAKNGLALWLWLVSFQWVWKMQKININYWSTRYIRTHVCIRAYVFPNCRNSYRVNVPSNAKKNPVNSRNASWPSLWNEEYNIYIHTYSSTGRTFLQVGTGNTPIHINNVSIHIPR